jgi:hypothetical protein
VYMGDWGFFLTPRMGSWKVALRSAVVMKGETSARCIERRGQRDVGCDARWVTLAFLYLSAIGRTNRSIFTGFLVNPSPTNVALLTIRFQLLVLAFPDLRTLNISSSAIPRTLGRGTEYLAARSFRRSLMADESALASC